MLLYHEHHINIFNNHAFNFNTTEIQFYSTV